MPYLQISLSPKLDDATKTALIREAGKLIELIPGKSESVLMVRLDDDADVRFRGICEKCAYVSVSLYKPSSFEAKQAFAKAFTESLGQLAGIEPSNVFLTYTEFPNWAANGNLM